MSETFYILLPSPDRTALLSVGSGSRTRLPYVLGRRRRLTQVLDDLARGRGIRAPFLRLAAHAAEGGGRRFLCELDAPSPEWQPRAPARWLPLEAADPVRLAPGLAAGVAGWIDEQRGGPLPSQRAPWARPGWLEEASCWVARHVVVRSGPRLVRQWPLSSVQRFETAEGPVYLKAVFSLFHHEPAVTEALARGSPDVVPEGVAVDRRRGLLLMRELAGPDVQTRPLGRWLETVRALAAIQQEWLGRNSEWSSSARRTEDWNACRQVCRPRSRRWRPRPNETCLACSAYASGSRGPLSRRCSFTVTSTPQTRSPAATGSSSTTGRMLNSRIPSSTWPPSSTGRETVVDGRPSSRHTRRAGPRRGTHAGCGGSRSHWRTRTTRSAISRSTRRWSPATAGVSRTSRTAGCSGALKLVA